NDLLFFTKKGIYYRMKVYEITPGNKNSKGRAIQNLLEIAPDDAINAVIPIKGIKDTEFAETHNLVFATKSGVIKKTSLREYVNAPTKGKKAIIIREDDQLIGVELTDGNSEIIMANRMGRAIRFHEKAVREMGRVSTGVRGMTLSSPDDEIVGMICMQPDTTNDVLVVSSNGYGKRSPLDDYRVTNRGGKGVKTLNVTDKTGELVAIKSVNDENDLVIINRSGITLRIRVADIRVQGRATQGVRLINLEKRNDVIASVCSTATDPEEETQEVDDTELPEDVSVADADLEADDADTEGSASEEK
ncbi:MAG: DNA gyrase subunit A, partial [Muribaculaceae bacterium]|nr:DNA gyrase subunit A [Muribaculaceae bacterium]